MLKRMGKKRKIFILSAMAAGIAIFFGRKRMRSKSEDAPAEGDWTPDEEAAPSDDSASADAESSDDSAAEEDSEEESEEKTG